FTKVLDEVLNDTKFQILDGESTCKASKSIARVHEEIFGSSIPLDLILATQGEELSTSEWKKLKVPTNMSMPQQGKNIRMNKAILTYLSNLPITNDDDNVFTVGMDFTGPMGYMFAIKRVEDIYVVCRLSTLIMPTYLYELSSFVDTLDRLYAWRHHHLRLKDIVLPAIRKRDPQIFFFNVLGCSELIDGDISPNMFLTPTHSREK
ncbi:hypothetical protein EC973_004809, partial [Apophysomyces ossiformis]